MRDKISALLKLEEFLEVAIQIIRILLKQRM